MNHITQISQRQLKPVENIRSLRKPLVQMIESAGDQVEAGGCVPVCPLCGCRDLASIWESQGGWRFSCHSIDCGDAFDVLQLGAKLRSMRSMSVLGGHE